MSKIMCEWNCYLLFLVCQYMCCLQLSFYSIWASPNGHTKIKCAAVQARKITKNIMWMLQNRHTALPANLLSHVSYYRPSAKNTDYVNLWKEGPKEIWNKLSKKWFLYFVFIYWRVAISDWIIKSFCVHRIFL